MEDEIICYCNEIIRGRIVKAIEENGLTTVEEVQRLTSAGDTCGGCIPDIEDILEEINNKNK